jgi:MFS family permease
MATMLKSLAIWSLYSPICKFACHKGNALIYFISYAGAISSTIKTRLSNSYLIGEIFGMLFFGWIIDRLGRRTGIVFATLFLILGIVLATAAHGKDNLGLFWMMIVARGIAGFGAGGEYPTCGTNSAEASDESIYVRRRRGILVAMSTDFAIDLGFVVAGVVALIVLACYNQNIVDGVWRICFGLGIVVSIICRYNTCRTTTYTASFLFRYFSFESAWWMPHNTASMPSSLTFHMSLR